MGILALLVGQSQLVNWFDVGVHSAVAGAYRQSGSVYGGSAGSWSAMPTTGNGANEFAAQLIAQYGVPVGMLGYASGGTLISQWDQSTDTLPRHAIKAVQDCGGAVEYILWAQGEADGSSGTAQATYETALTNVIANFRAQITNRSTKANLPIVLSLLGRGTSIGTDAQASAIRAAQFAIAGSVSDVYIGAETLDIPLADAAHYSAAGYVTHGKRMAQTVKYLLGDATYHRGPSIASAVVVDATTTDVTISHRGGTDFTPTSAIVGFEIDDGGSIIVPSAAVRQSASVVRLTHASLSSGSPTVRYGYGADGGDTYASTISNILVDNTALTLPLEQSPQNVAISASTSGVFVKISGVYLPSISVHAKVAGVYKLANEIHLKQAGVYAPI
ncbi:MAG: sialate O-acetylesterase [Azonexus sp.]